MGESKRKQGRKPKNPVAETMDFQMNNPGTTSSAAMDDVFPVSNAEIANADPPTARKGRGRPRKAAKHVEKADTSLIASPARRASRAVENNGDSVTAVSISGDVARHSVGEPLPRWENVVKVVPSMDAVVKVFCVHTEPNFSLPWQRKRQYSSSSSGFIIGGRRVLTNAHSVEHYTQVKLKKRGSDTKYLATVLAIGTECDIGKGNLFLHSFI